LDKKVGWERFYEVAETPASTYLGSTTITQASKVPFGWKYKSKVCTYFFQSGGFLDKVSFNNFFEQPPPAITVSTTHPSISTSRPHAHASPVKPHNRKAITLSLSSLKNICIDSANTTPTTMIERLGAFAFKCLAKFVVYAGTRNKKHIQDTKKNTEAEDTKTEETKADETETCCCPCPHNTDARTPRKQSQPASEGWQYNPNADFPWRLEQVVDEEENWRGTWVLDVKDMNAMDWGIDRVAKKDGRGGRYQWQPSRQLPFPVDVPDHGDKLDGGQDDLMVWLGKS
jgi:hypothetical protein